MFRLQRAEGLGGLRELALRGCRFDAETSAKIARLTSLKKLDFCKSWCRDADVEQFGGLTQLTECDLSFTDVTAKGLQTILALPRLEQLNVLGSLVHFDQTMPEPPPSHLHIDISFGVLSQADARHHRLTGGRRPRHGDSLAFWDRWNLTPWIADYDLQSLDQLHNLTALNLWGAHVTDDGLRHLRGLTELRALNLADTRVTNEGLRHLQGLSALESLSVAETAVDGAEFRTLESLPKLTALDLGRCDLTDDGLKDVARLPRLEVLRLAGTRITDAGLVHLKPLRNLRWLDLSDTQVTAEGIAAVDNRQLRYARKPVSLAQTFDANLTPWRDPRSRSCNSGSRHFPRGPAESSANGLEPSEIGPIPPRFPRPPLMGE